MKNLIKKDGLYYQEINDKKQDRMKLWIAMAAVLMLLAIIGLGKI